MEPTQSAPPIDAQLIRQCNSTIEAASLPWYGFRFPGIRVEAYFYYKLVEDPKYCVATHAHSHWEFTRVARGRALYQVQKPEMEVEVAVDSTSGNYLFIPSMIPHRWSIPDAPLLLNSWQIKFFPEDSHGEDLVRSLSQSVSDRDFLVGASHAQIRAEALLFELLSSKFNPSLLGPMLNGIARIVVGGILGTAGERVAELIGNGPNPALSSHELVSKLKSFLEENLHHNITLKDLESHFHYSSRHLNRLFRDQENRSIGQYLRDRRFELASRLLATTSRSIKDIALSLGFGNVSHFCRSFRERENLSPNEYRKVSEEGAQSRDVSWLTPSETASQGDDLVRPEMQ